MNFRQRFLEVTRKKNSLLCVGLDPVWKRMPQAVKSRPEPFFDFCVAIINSTQQMASAFKLNLAFFEAEGSRGWRVLEKLMDVFPPDILRIADAKRADIGTSSEMYAKAILECLDFDAVTVNPYLGQDAVEPFLNWSEKGAIILCLTSNPGAQDFQYFSDGRQPLYMEVLNKVKSWNTRQNCAIVAGATHVAELSAIRKAAPDLPLLVPGLGAQGGDLEAAVLGGTDSAGEMAIFNFSRSIIYCSSGDDFAEAAAREAEYIKETINKVRKTKR
ncbi:MAG: orotidine-5'-phosphate decarboxylase [bacterium]